MGKRLGIILIGICLLMPSGAFAYWSLFSYFTIFYPNTLLSGLTSRDLNGVSLNGKQLDGHYIVSVSLESAMVKGKPIKVKLDGTKFKRSLPKTLKQDDEKVNNAFFSAFLDDGSALSLRIDAIESVKYRDDPNLIHYQVSYETQSGWQNLCGEDEYGYPLGAIPLLGRWDYSEGTETGGSKIEDDTVFTFACEGYVLHKCVIAQYKPWETVLVCNQDKKKNQCTEVSLSEYHQACTRMLRADFCGDGTSYTQNNVQVSLYDGIGIRLDSEDWAFEAEWDEDGAICLTDPRLEQSEIHCREELKDDTCGDPSHFQDGTPLFSEIP